MKSTTAPTVGARPDWLPIDPDATPAEQRLLDEANGLLALLRMLDAGYALTGHEDPVARARLFDRLNAIRRELGATS